MLFVINCSDICNCSDIKRGYEREQIQGGGVTYKDFSTFTIFRQDLLINVSKRQKKEILQGNIKTSISNFSALETIISDFQLLQTIHNRNEKRIHNAYIDLSLTHKAVLHCNPLVVVPRFSSNSQKIWYTKPGLQEVISKLELK